jgi:hypothetical protein
MIACGLFMLTGCVTVVEEVEPLAKARLVVSRAGEQATLQFASERGVIYEVLYASSRDAGTTWKKLPGAERVLGTGQLIQFKDRIPYGAPRYYRLKVVQVVRD